VGIPESLGYVYEEATAMTALRDKVERLSDEAIAYEARSAIANANQNLLDILVEVAIARVDRRRAIEDLEESLEITPTEAPR
jgi:Flp pilus assembly protein TadD